MEKKSSVAKWEGKVSKTVTKATADQIWSLFIDFFNFHKWFPNMSICYGVHGVNGEVGGIRYCSGFSLPNEEGGAEENSWSKERLVAVDRKEMSMSYEMVECNVGFTSYLSTLKVVRGVDDGGCVIEWSFAVDPVEGLTYEYLVEKYQDGLDQTAMKMEDAFVHKKAV